MAHRRVITGHDAHGRSVFVADEQVEVIAPAAMPGASFNKLWGCDAVPSVPNRGVIPAHHAFFPAADGVRVITFTLPPQGGPEPDPAQMDTAMAQLETKLPGLIAHMEPDNPGMHTTQTVDVDVVLSGEVDLELDDGAEVHLVPGDVVIQNGTRHRWHNRGSVPCTMLSVLVGARQG